MKLIDEKGKLFGIINPIDLLVLALVLLIGAGVIYKTQFSGTVVEPKKITTKIMVPWLRPEEANSIKVGDTLVASAALTDVKITKVELTPGRAVNVTDQGKSVLTTDPYRKDVYITLEGQTPLSGAEIKFAGQELRQGKEFFVKTLTYEYRGFPLEINITD